MSDEQNKMVYLAIPYTGMEAFAFEVANKVAGELMKRGYVVFSPISHSHTIAEMCEMPTDWGFWECQDRRFIERCDEVIVICLDGWDRSRGVTAEIDFANDIGKLVRFFDVDETDDYIKVFEGASKEGFQPIEFELE